MKNLINKIMSKKLVIGGFMALLTIGAFAQNKKRGFNKSDMTPEQMAEIQTKKMALHLDLTDAQQKKIFNLNKEQAIKRVAKRKEMQALRDKDEKPKDRNSFENQKSRLDAQLAHQDSMKEILSEDQYQIWKKSRKNRGDKMKKRGKRKMMKGKAKGKKGKERPEDKK